MSEKRRLAAIMAVDVVGYSRLMGEDEAGTARAVREHREAAWPLVADRGGRIVKTMGDGLLLEFPSVVAAVECAVAIQTLMGERNAGIFEANRIVYRIGVNLGDVLIEGDDILGEGVNIAARLESVCAPGGVLVSSGTYDQTRGKIDAEFIDLGEMALKNIARPVRAYAIKLGSAPAPSATAPAPSATAPAGPPRLSLVVLPFTNPGGGEDHDYFVDGVTESLTTDLSRIRGAFVIGRNTAFTYKGKAIDLKQIGRDLNVRYVLQGSVQRGGSRMRVNVQLIDAESGAHIWAERFDKPVADLFDMQDEIVSRLANALETQLALFEARRAEQIRNPNSIDLYFQGLVWFNKSLSPDSLSRAQTLFDQAVAIEPSNIHAVVYSAIVDMISAGSLVSSDRSARLERAEASLTIAHSLASEDFLVTFAMGMLYMYTNRLTRSVASYERSLVLNRNFAAAHANVGLVKYQLGRFEETEAHVTQALRLSPYDVLAYLWYNYVGMAKLLLGFDEQALDWLDRSAQANPNFFGTHLFAAAAYAHLGRMEEAKRAAKVGVGLNPSFTIARRRAEPFSRNEVYLEKIERWYAGMELAGAPKS